MKVFLLLIFSTLLSLLAGAQSVIPSVKPRPAEYEYLAAPDSTGKREALKSPAVSYNYRGILPQKLPYPVIFIHGLNSSSSTWNATTDFMDTAYGLTYGGRIDFCLNQDGNNSTTNKNLWPAAGADVALYTSLNNLVVGDYYYLNFDVGSNGVFHPNGGSYDVISNEQAIAKQGLAVKWAVSMVLQKTGRDKVILMGHSMGGLASREYLQNSALWQADGQHHVAKLVTTGTPHGGSNSTAFGLSGIDENSEAVRDLRTSYYYTGKAGAYLFGGTESLPYMWDRFCCYFYNADVNCNGTTGENIAGLNQKSIYTNLDYSCIIGECSGCPLAGDGVVSDVSANLKNYYPSLNANLFYYNASAFVEIHTALPKQNYQNMEGLDEANDYPLSYHIGFDTAYAGFVTMQPSGGSGYDYDDYKFSAPVKSIVSITINNITLADQIVRIKNSSYADVGATIHSNGSPNINFTQVIDSGQYYFQVYGTPTSTSYLYPYEFTLSRIDYPATLNLTLFLEGFYNSVSQMKATLYNLGLSSDVTATDSIEVSLWAPAHLQNTSPDYSTKVILHTNGTATINYPRSVIGGSYYIAVRHRNSLETWSHNAITFSEATNYNFSTSLSQAYDNGINTPMRNMGNGVYALYGGNTNRDATIDASDLAIVDNDAQRFAFGYNDSDCTGDAVTDAGDMAIIDNNMQRFLYVARP